MEPNDVGQKLRGILEAIASGRSCEQILAADRSLTYHDIFHAVAEAPTTFWSSKSRRGKRKGSLETAPAARPLVRHRAD